MLIMFIFGLYFYISVCVVAFDFLYVFYEWNLRRLLPRRKAQIEQILNHQYVLLAEARQPDEKQMRQLFTALGKINNLSVFEMLLKDHLQNPEFKRLLQMNMPLLYELSGQYKKRPVEEQAFLCHIFTRLPLADCEDRVSLEKIANGQIPRVGSDSIYLSENAFKALLSFGLVSAVIKGVLLLNQKPDRMREKLLTDNLLEFKGSHEELSSMLWDHFPDFCPRMQVAVVNYLRLLPKDAIDQTRFAEPMLMLAQDESGSKEVRLAMIRYLQKYPVPAALPVLLSYVDRTLSLTNWEFAVVSATALSAYPCQETHDALMRAVRSPNWYLRYNSSDSLIHLGTDVQEVVDQLADRYAREMISFRKQIYDLKKRRKEPV